MNGTASSRTPSAGFTFGNKHRVPFDTRDIRLIPPFSVFFPFFPFASLEPAAEEGTMAISAHVSSAHGLERPATTMLGRNLGASRRFQAGGWQSKGGRERCGMGEADSPRLIPDRFRIQVESRAGGAVQDNADGRGKIKSNQIVRIEANRGKGQRRFRGPGNTAG